MYPGNANVNINSGSGWIWNFCLDPEFQKCQKIPCKKSSTLPAGLNMAEETGKSPRSSHKIQCCEYEIYIPVQIIHILYKCTVYIYICIWSDSQDFCGYTLDTVTQFFWGKIQFEDKKLFKPHCFCSKIKISAKEQKNEEKNNICFYIFFILEGFIIRMHY